MTVTFGGEQYVGSGGTTFGAKVESGGAEVVFGLDSGASLSGTQYLYGTASGGTGQSGGVQLVTVAYGGEEYFGAGGTALDTGRDWARSSGIQFRVSNSSQRHPI